MRGCVCGPVERWWRRKAVSGQRGVPGLSRGSHARSTGRGTVRKRLESLPVSALGVSVEGDAGHKVSKTAWIDRYNIKNPSAMEGITG